jgi:hypothetical protein
VLPFDMAALLTIALVVPGAKAQRPPNGFFPGERIGAVSRSTDTLDVFTADDYGAMYHARWDPSNRLVGLVQHKR